MINDDKLKSEMLIRMTTYRILPNVMAVYTACHDIHKITEILYLNISGS